MNENIDSSTKFERYHLFNHIYAKIYDYKKNIKPSPNPYYMLEKYYGNLSIQEYRALLRNERFAAEGFHKIEYDWNTDFLKPPKWLKEPRPWDWMVLAKQK